MRKIFNVSNVLGTIAFFAMVLAPAAYQGEMYITSMVLVAIMAVCAHLSIMEEGKKK